MAARIPLLPARAHRFSQRKAPERLTEDRAEKGFVLSGPLAGVRNNAQARRPNAIRPALALADFGMQPGLVLFNTFLRAKTLERSTVPHQPELAVAVGAVVLHGFLPEWRLTGRLRITDRTNALQQMLLQCNISITALY